MKVFYTDSFVLPLPEGHRFPIAKYSLLRQRVVKAGLAPPDDLRVPHAATDKELVRAHGARNFPFHKEHSDLDIGLEDRADDAVYLDALEKGLRWSLESIEAELAIYVAGLRKPQPSPCAQMFCSRAPAHTGI